MSNGHRVHSFCSSVFDSNMRFYLEAVCSCDGGGGSESFDSEQTFLCLHPQIKVKNQVSSTKEGVPQSDHPLLAVLVPSTETVLRKKKTSPPIWSHNIDRAARRVSRLFNVNVKG